MQTMSNNDALYLPFLVTDSRILLQVTKMKPLQKLFVEDKTGIIFYDKEYVLPMDEKSSTKIISVRRLVGDRSRTE